MHLFRIVSVVCGCVDQFATEETFKSNVHHIKAIYVNAIAKTAIQRYAL